MNLNFEFFTNSWIWGADEGCDWSFLGFLVLHFLEFIRLKKCSVGIVETLEGQQDSLACSFIFVILPQNIYFSNRFPDDSRLKQTGYSENVVDSDL